MSHYPSHDEQEERFERMERLTEYIHAKRSRGFSRREFLKYGLSLGLSLPAISAVLSGCGMGQSNLVALAPTATNTPAPTSTPTI
ncbi:MAG: hypothetical protein HC893_11835, partial [Chloroflexaceae bacterium]|nr:hypothetical protein [Chloroflexaceae bacterium]